MAVKGAGCFSIGHACLPDVQSNLGSAHQPFYMKNLRSIGWLRGTLLGALLLFAIPSAWAHSMGGGFHSGGMGGGFHSMGGEGRSSGGRNFAFHHNGGHFFHHDGAHFFRHDRDHFFHHHHHFDDRFFFAFDFPYYGYPYDYYPYDYGYYDYYGSSYDDQYWSDLTAAVQTELNRAGYYYEAIDGAFGPDTARAVRAYRRANGLPVTSQIDRGLLKSLNI
jgi:putative peptidoglycan binding protein